MTSRKIWASEGRLREKPRTVSAATARRSTSCAIGGASTSKRARPPTSSSPMPEASASLAAGATNSNDRFARIVPSGEVVVIDPGPENAPPYPAYALLGAAVEPVIHFVGTAQAIAIATDGAAPIAGELGALADDARFFRNRSLLRKRLTVRAAELWDDTTIAIVRRGRP